MAQRRAGDFFEYLFLDREGHEPGNPREPL
jgi:hypothetical protein